jgi:hypothetical protein
LEGKSRGTARDGKGFHQYRDEERAGKMSNQADDKVKEVEYLTKKIMELDDEDRYTAIFMAVFALEERKRDFLALFVEPD